jgi:hypothetical protein
VDLIYLAAAGVGSPGTCGGKSDRSIGFHINPFSSKRLLLKLTIWIELNMLARSNM